MHAPPCVRVVYWFGMERNFAMLHKFDLAAAVRRHVVVAEQPAQPNAVAVISSNAPHRPLALGDSQPTALAARAELSATSQPSAACLIVAMQWLAAPESQLPMLAVGLSSAVVVLNCLNYELVAIKQVLNNQNVSDVNGLKCQFDN